VPALDSAGRMRGAGVQRMTETITDAGQQTHGDVTQLYRRLG
jgi:hypothetical protein